MNSKKPRQLPREALLVSTSQGYLLYWQLKASTFPCLEVLEKCGDAYARRLTLTA